MLLSSALLLLLFLTVSGAESPKVIFAQPGRSVTLPREDWMSVDKVYVRWYFGTDTDPLIWKNPQGGPSSSNQGPGKDLQNRVSFSPDYSLVISPVLDNDFGLFKCIQQQLLTEKEMKYQLHRVTMPTTMLVFAGDTLSLTCGVESVPVHYTLTWTVPEGIKYQNQNTHTVTLSNVSYSHRGEWICSIKFNGLTFNAKTVVSILDLSPSPPDPIYTSVNSSPPLLPCSFPSDISWSVLNGSGLQGGSWDFLALNSSDVPRTLLTLNPTPPAWKVTNKANDFLQERSLKDHDLSVKSFSKVSVDYRGTYVCRLRFKRGAILKSMVQLEVLEVLSSDSRACVGDTVNLTCTLGHPMPSGLEVKWIPPKTSHLSLSEIHQHNLSIPAVTVQDGGDWKCELWRNRTALASAVITLEIVPVGAWVFVTIGSGVFIFVLLLVITIVIVHRRRQNMKSRPRKRKFCCCKNPQAKGFYKT